MDKVQWGIIGAGDVTEVKSGPGFQRAEHSELVAVMRRTGHLAKDYAHRHGVDRWYEDAESLIHDSRVNAVYIATPPHVHKEYTLMAAAAGKPVYCEKPMALRHADCLEMIEACQTAGVPLWIAYYRRQLEKFVQIKELLSSGAIGEVHLVEINLHQPPIDTSSGHIPWRVTPEISGGGLFVDVGSHMLDILDYFFGPITQASGRAVNRAGLYPAEDNVVAHFSFDSGLVGTGSWSFTSTKRVDKTVLHGTQGKITYSCFVDVPVVVQSADVRKELPLPFPTHIQQPLIQSIVDELLGSGSCASTGESGARTTWVIDQVLADVRDPA